MTPEENRAVIAIADFADRIAGAVQRLVNECGSAEAEVRGAASRSQADDAMKARLPAINDAIGELSAALRGLSEQVSPLWLASPRLASAAHVALVSAQDAATHLNSNDAVSEHLAAMVGAVGDLRLAAQLDPGDDGD